MSDPLPMFPLNTVVFPGMSVPLHVFEDRYRMLVRHLLEVEDPAARVFGTVAIREGYEVGDHGAQSVYRVGCVLQLTEADRRSDGTYDIVAVARERLKLEQMERGVDFPQGVVAVLPEPEVEVPQELLDKARATFTAFRAAMAELQGDPFSGTLPRDPDYLAWTLSALTPLPMAERQSLLEAEDATERLVLVTRLLTEELRAINVIPSLPATQVARTAWSPN
ncbi:LON peptidase substrate-binding domain-containing protein [Nocardioides sp. zg-1308]|uniref:LON peptidase substrate-binding domain-containing protein n=1 Tax=Nocardioides renjunii TaxID=3095075 RepID=A0ABU5KH03_9ACTN|nr:LON peptidase substrate-binding domain-containing protein [Nocardioides sp. S-58]MDZ5663730.1 LON peptidase substrate-binding domain-containing protein [Nocardioides sp. S-58]NPD06841.1 LON peptidase substrate-binding domain-containing protein [Nocardioides sp. zg-1308]